MAVQIKTTKRVVPMIYAYTTPEIKRHDGWTKIGYTEQDVDTRIRQQTHTADVKWHKEWQSTAVYDDGSGEVFHDTDFHVYLRKAGVEQESGKDNEWFHITGPKSRNMLYDFKAHDDSAIREKNAVLPYTLRDEQVQAVQYAKDYFETHPGGEYLWNCKPRFGKTLSVYDLCKRMHFKTVLIVTNRPAIANSWYDDYAKFLGEDSGFYFVSNVSALKDKPLCQSRETYIKSSKGRGCIEFISLQDLKGARGFGGHYDKLQEVKTINWDILVIDEAHEGVDTYKTDIAFDNIHRNYTLHLSGTPFKALANDKFDEDAIFNWTYADEQRKKRDWDNSQSLENPYANLPKLHLFTYELSEIIKDDIAQGIDVDGENVAFAFDLNEFFATDGRGHFKHNEAVNHFLDALTTQEKFPFSTPELRDELKHTFWLLNRVDSAKALKYKLNHHETFKEYEVVLAAGDGRTGDKEEKATKKAYDEVVDAIANNDKTITLSVGQLTTGVTIPEWTAVLMLSGIQSPALYMQAAFRAQNPCMFQAGKNQCYRKENAYVFDFDPARSLDLFEQFANDLSSDTAAGHGDVETRKEHIRELLNFFPVIGEDENGKMIELDAEKVLTIPRKVRSKEVVRRGFMCDYLFQNITNIFRAPQEVVDIIAQVKPVAEAIPITPQTGEELYINDDGDVDIEPTDEWVIGTATELFSDKVFDQTAEAITETMDAIATPEPTKPSVMDNLKTTLKEEIKTTFIEPAKDHYHKDFTSQREKQLVRDVNKNIDYQMDKHFDQYNIEKDEIEHERSEKLDRATDTEAVQINKEYDKKQQDAINKFQDSVMKVAENLTQDFGEKVVQAVETDKKEKEKKDIEDNVRDHLRGFTRTIPSFLMAYGSEDTTLEMFDQIIPDDVFKEVTSITLDEFRFLRDGGEYTDDETGETKHYEGHLFDSVVFDDSIAEFMALKDRLADYFDPSIKGDIFDYIPPQRTNQIFTPKKIVKEMVDDLEKENPGCFDAPDATFADLYMKSGMYITEIVTRLYQSDKMKRLFPDRAKRLNYIFAKQVYGCAPTEIIYRICLRYILGFSDDIPIEKNNIKLCDTLEYAKRGTLEMKLEELFPELRVDSD